MANDGCLELKLQFQVPTSPSVGVLSITDYSSHLEGITVNRAGIGQYNCKFSTDLKIDESKLPIVCVGSILSTGVIIPVNVGCANFNVTFNPNAEKYAWDVTFTVYTSNGLIAVDIIGYVCVKLGWATTKIDCR